MKSAKRNDRDKKKKTVFREMSGGGSSKIVGTFASIRAILEEIEDHFHKPHDIDERMMDRFVQNVMPSVSPLAEQERDMFKNLGKLEEELAEESKRVKGTVRMSQYRSPRDDRKEMGICIHGARYRSVPCNQGDEERLLLLDPSKPTSGSIDKCIPESRCQDHRRLHFHRPFPSPSRGRRCALDLQSAPLDGRAAHSNKNLRRKWR